MPEVFRRFPHPHLNKAPHRIMSTESIGFGSAYLIVGGPACEKLTTVRWGINLAAQQWPLNMAHDFASAEDGKPEEIGLARNRIAEICLQVNAKYLWFVDDDVLPPNYAV